MKRYIKDYKNIHPAKQGILIIGLISVLTLICLIIQIKSMNAWNIIISPVLLFSFYNPVITSLQQKPLRNLIISAFIFTVLLVYIYFAGNLISDISFQQSHELHFILLLLIIFFILFNILCLLFKGLLHLLHSIDD